MGDCNETLGRAEQDKSVDYISVVCPVTYDDRDHPWLSVSCETMMVLYGIRENHISMKA